MHQIFDGKKFEKHVKSKSHLIQEFEELKCNLGTLDVNKYTYQLQLNSIKHLLKTVEKNKMFHL